jgi:hypothetical protein
MSTVKSDNSDLTINASGSTSDIKFQANGVEKASISSAGAFTSTTIDATKLTGDLPVISGANLTGLPAGDNTPYVHAYRTDNQSVSDGTWTTLAMWAEYNDSDGAYSTSTYKFTVPSGEAGKYFVLASGCMNTGSSSHTLGETYIQVRKNGSVYQSNQPGTATYNTTNGPHTADIHLSFVIDLAATDYLDLQGYISCSSSPSTVRFYRSSLIIFKIGA